MKKHAMIGPIRRLSQCHPTKMFSTGEYVHKMLNTLDIQELSGTLTTNGQTLPGNSQETKNFQQISSRRNNSSKFQVC